MIKAVNHRLERNTLLVRFQGAGVPQRATAKLHTVSAGLVSASLDDPDAITVVSRTLNYSKDLDPYAVAVLDIRAE